MPPRRPPDRPTSQPEPEGDDEYDLLLLLDRLESLAEDMDELGIRDRDELEARIVALHRQIDQTGNSSATS